MFLTIITFLIVLSVLVFAHELGHFFVARKFGVKAEEFGFGFPPRIWGIYKNNNGAWKQVKGNKEVNDALGTIYSVNWIPMGGFVKIKGENGANENDADSFAARPLWQRAVILSAGVTMNIVLAAIIISLGLIIGMPQAVEDVGPGAKISDEKIQIAQVIANTPAANTGIMPGDIIISIDGRQFADTEEVRQYADEHKNQELNYRIKRGQETSDYRITPQIMSETGKGGIGVVITKVGIVQYPLYYAIWEGIKTTFVLIFAILAAFYQLLKSLFTGGGVSADVAGPVGIAVLTGQVARMGLIYVMQFAAMLSINLAIINFLPFPALDGGRVLFLFIEKLKGKPVRRELEALIHNIGFILLMALILLITFKDVMKFGDKFKILFDKIFG